MQEFIKSSSHRGRDKRLVEELLPLKGKTSNELMMSNIKGFKDVSKAHKSYTIRIGVQEYKLEAQKPTKIKLGRQWEETNVRSFAAQNKASIAKRVPAWARHQLVDACMFIDKMEP